MQALKTFLWFDGKAEEAVDFWVSVFRDAKKGPVRRYGNSFPVEKWRGKVLTASFTLRGQEFVALNAGAEFQFTPAVSFMVSVHDQQELDGLWDKLGSDGGAPMACGWITDRFGLTWQVVPDTLLGYISDPDPAKAKRSMDAMMSMIKFDFAALKKAHDGA